MNSDRDRRLASRIWRSLFDPLVLAAVVGLLGGIGTTLVGRGLDREAEREKAMCERAFAFLQDEAINPSLEQDDGFYRLQLGVAGRCSRRID